MAMHLQREPWAVDNDIQPQATPDSASSVSGFLNTVKVQYRTFSTSDRIGFTSLKWLLLNDHCYFTKSLLVSSLCATLEAANIASFHKTDNSEPVTLLPPLKVLICGIHVLIAQRMLAEQLPVSLQVIPSRYITMVNMVIPDMVMGTEYDGTNFPEDDLSTVGDMSPATSLDDLQDWV